MNNVKQKTIKGVFWNTIEKFLVKGTSFIIGIILARILLPSDYGLIGMLSIFIAISNVFVESGLAKALIQKQNCTDIDYSTAFFTNFSISIVLYVLFYITAPFISRFYNEPLLLRLLRVFALNFVIGSLNVVQRAKLMAKMDFKALAKINFLGTLLGGLLGVFLAYNGFGVWALVFQAIIANIVMALLFPYFSKWKPILAFSSTSFKSLFNYGSKLLVTGVVSTIVNNISIIAIGKMYKSKMLGFFTRATQFTDLIAYTINDVLGTVTFPVLSELQDERERLITVYRKSLFYSAFCIFPVMFLIALLARPMVIVLLTDKWLPSVILIQILCMARMFTPLSAINMNLLNAVGRPDLYMKVDLSKIPLILIMLAITIPISVQAIVIGDLISTFICFFINTYYPGKLFGYGAWQQIKDWKKIYVALLSMSIVVYGFTILVHNPYIQFFIGGLIGVLVYLLTSTVLKIIDLKLLLGYIFKNKK